MDLESVIGTVAAVVVTIVIVCWVIGGLVTVAMVPWFIRECREQNRKIAAGELVRVFCPICRQLMLVSPDKASSPCSNCEQLSWW